MRPRRKASLFIVLLQNNRSLVKEFHQGISSFGLRAPQATNRAKSSVSALDELPLAFRGGAKLGELRRVEVVEHEGGASSVGISFCHGEKFGKGGLEVFRGEAGNAGRGHGFMAAVSVHRLDAVVDVGERDLDCICHEGLFDQGWVEEACSGGGSFRFAGRAVVCACEDNDGLSSEGSSGRASSEAEDEVHGVWRRDKGEERVNGGVNGSWGEYQGAAPDAGSRIVFAGGGEIQAAQGVDSHGDGSDNTEAVASAVENIEESEFISGGRWSDLEDFSCGGDDSERYDAVGHPTHDAVYRCVAAS